MNKLYLNINDIKKQKDLLLDEYNNFKSKNLNLDMSRGKPSIEQINLSMKMLNVLNNKSTYINKDGIDYRNYGLLFGIPEARKLFAKLMGVHEEQVILGGNSSLNMMFDTISCIMTHGICGNKPWIKQDKIKFLCPVPGYDRHFSMLSYYGIEMINVPMKNDGPNMDIVEQLVENDSSIKGIWCVPKYSNPQGITYSNDVVKRFANLKPAANDFRIFWDNAYAIHDLTDDPDHLLNIMDECKKAKNEDIVIIFCSTSKITFPGSGVAAMAASENNLKSFKKQYSIKTIGYDKINQLRHLNFFKDYHGILKHMKKHRQILKPKFDTIINVLNEEFKNGDLISWTEPKGGYFISVDVPNGCAKKVVQLCQGAGVKLTPAGATFPNGFDPKDSNIRLSPTYSSINELKLAMQLFCLCIKLAIIEIL